MRAIRGLWMLLAWFAPIVAQAQCESWKVETVPVPPDHEIKVEAGETFKAMWTSLKAPTFGRIAGDFGAAIYADCRIKVQFEDLRIVVPQEVIVDDCARGHVVAHELQHVKFRRELIANAARDLPPFINGKAPGDDLAKGVNAWLDTLEQRDKALDSHEEYDTNRTACGGAIFRLTNFRQGGAS